MELFDGNGSVANGKIQEINKAYITFAIGDILIKEHPYQKFYQAIIIFKKREFDLFNTKACRVGSELYFYL